MGNPDIDAGQHKVKSYSKLLQNPKFIVTLHEKGPLD